jgi:hypothetical protein
VTLRLTPDLLAAGYDFLRQTGPFKGWKLPEGDEIGFAVIADPKVYADFGTDEKGIPIIRVSTAKNGHTQTILATLGHEMIHLHQHLKGLTRGGEHNADFWKRAKRVCALHGFDPKTF